MVPYWVHRFHGPLLLREREREKEREREREKEREKCVSTCFFLILEVLRGAQNVPRGSFEAQ